MMGEVIRVSGRTPDVGEFLREAMLSQRFADVALCCPGGQRFFAHRLVLSAASPYLQEVLLAHSKSSNHCEPITVILAEIEAPELAALLAFVYTGSATVPRARLHSFLRAAENLRIALPPIPVLMTCAAERSTNCKQEEDVKISPRYLQCDQYPSCEQWCQEDRNLIDPSRKGSFEFVARHPSTEIQSRLQSNASGAFLRSRFENTWQVPGYPIDQGRLDGALEDDGRSYHPDRSLEKSAVVGPDAKLLDPLELRLRSDYARLRTPYTMRRYQEDERTFAREEQRDGSFQGRTTALLHSARARSLEKSDYTRQSGEDLTCGESCCRWRTARRHVANRVTASPWRQIVRPHHLPKIQPIVLQTHLDDAETGESGQEASVALPTSPCHETAKSHENQLPSSDHFYGYEVPKSREAIFDNATCTSPETRRSDYFPPALPYTPNDSTLSSSIRSNEAYFQVPSKPSTTESSPSAGYSSQVLPTKPEISHPVSRLCDTVEERRDTNEKKQEVLTEEKVAERIFVNSDSNNNDASSELSPRSKAAGQEDHKCDQCGKTFVTRASLKVHNRTHSGEKPFRCADCGKQFSQLRNYKYHRSVHEGTREFAATCPECGKYFNDRGYLSSHMKIHRNRKEYGCAECGKSFNQRVAYNMHVRIHTGVKPHQCEQCGKAFSRKMLLKQHLRTHSGERPYQCQVCQKAFADRSNMTLHTRLHSGLKPYQCTLCSKAFTKKHHLKTHLNYHTGTKPYSCPNCALRFSQSSNMRTHYKKCAVNNPGGLKASQEGTPGVEASKTRVEVVEVVTPSDALTPPNSDQESSILTPISKSAPVEAGAT